MKISTKPVEIARVQVYMSTDHDHNEVKKKSTRPEKYYIRKEEIK